VLVVAILAQKTKCAAGVLFQIPNQRISFPTDPTGPNNRRGEDSLIAMTWWHFINNPTDEQAEWILELPMTKSAVKAMDVLQAAMPAYTNHASPQQFVVLGASKRGWTTWLTAAVDSRVTAAVPIVLDALDMRGFLHRQYTAYNGFSFALQPYVELNITQNIDSEAAIRMFEIIDPVRACTSLCSLFLDMVLF
jgi:PhoPQ-activated pathogenicity-related protein